jgi:CRISPR-associated protein Cmr1
MESITFECRLITDYFSSGADGITPELRPSSIKGALRFWWRALNGHLTLAELKRQEDRIFGGGGENATKSKVIVRCTHPNWTQEKLNMYERPGKSIPQNGVPARTTPVFQVTLSLTGAQIEVFGLIELKTLFELVCILGGLGKRSRRGRGCINITRTKEDGSEWTNYESPHNIEGVGKKIAGISKWFEVKNNAISFEYKGTTEPYPLIQKIQIGRPDAGVLRKIDQTSHLLLAKHSTKYEATLGHTNRRFASPIYTSVMVNQNQQLIPVITTLKNISDFAHKAHVSGAVADEFKNQILQNNE